MTIKGFGILPACALLAIFLCISCTSKKEKIPILEEKDVHELYKKVLKEKEKNNPPSSPQRGTAVKPPEQQQ